jgi:hypothetical protein
MAGDPTGRISHLPEMHRGVAWKEPVRCASTANVTLASGVENGDTLDGITLATGDRILLKDQSTGSQNGIYTVNASGAPTPASSRSSTTRAADRTISTIDTGRVAATLTGQPGDELTGRSIRRSNRYDGIALVASVSDSTVAPGAFDSEGQR